MDTQIKTLAQVALGLALTFTFSCSGSENNNGSIEL